MTHPVSVDPCSMGYKIAQIASQSLPGSFSDLVVSRNLDDLAIPGVAVEIAPDTADSLGVVIEDAVDLDDAIDANLDLARH